MARSISSAQFFLNGNSYLLLYTLSGGIPNGGSGYIGLATDVTGAATTAELVGFNNFDGLGHTISGLTGTLISQVDNLASVSNVRLVLSGAGTLASQNSGIIQTSSASGATTAAAPLVIVNDNGIVQGSHSDAAVNTNSDSAGGLVAENQGTGKVLNSYATGAVFNASAFEVEGGTGGLVGTNTGLVSSSYATGAVNGAFAVGGLVGLNDGLSTTNGVVQNSYATGAVYARGVTNNVETDDWVGGLVGANFSLAATSISNSYSTGAVSGNPIGQGIGGLLGFNRPTAVVTNSYWDTQTSGQQTSAAGTGLTTVQFQTGGLPTGFDSSLWGGATGGLYPYLKIFFRNGVQAVSGFAYTDAGVTPLASGANGAVTVSVIGNGNAFGTATTGTNGYYYILAPAGLLASGNSLLAYTTANPVTGSTNAATLATATGAANQSGVNIYGNAITETTNATLLSAAPTLAQMQTDASAAANGNAAAFAAVAGATGQGFVATGASFTIDQVVTTSSTFLVQTTTANAPITVAAPITIGNTGSLGLLSGGALAINAPINVTGAGSVNLAAAYDTTTVPGASLLQLSFGNGASIDYGSTNNGGRLDINGAAYTLLYNMSDVQALNASAAALSDNYAIATSLDASGTSGWQPIGTDSCGCALDSGQGFSGIIEGLGHTISNLTVDIDANSNAGLFGYSSGTIRDIGLVGGSVTGGGLVGGLVGTNAGGTISQAYATSAVTGGDQVGGLVGTNTGGTISQAYATGAVTGNSTAIGGLVGYSDGTIRNAYATGAVRGSGYVGGLVGLLSGKISNAYATGAVIGNGFVGGLAGYSGGTISNAYATGAVTGNGFVGGLAGYSGGTISNAYATGAVIGSAFTTGGLVGQNDGTVTSSYWDSTSTLQANGVGSGSGTVTNLVEVTSAFSQGAYGNFNFTTDWYMIDGQTRPFGRWEYSTNIVNAHQLQLMSMNLNASYTLGANIDASETSGFNPSGMWSLAGFVPIGTGSRFNGSLDGRGFTITSLSINRPSEDNVGLFSTLYLNGTVTGVGLIGAEIIGNQNVGTLAGSNLGIITNSYATIDVCGCGKVDGINSVGGLVGLNAGLVSGSHSDVPVFGLGNSVGGLVGFAAAGSIDTSYATGTVFGDAVFATNVGGLNRQHQSGRHGHALLRDRECRRQHRHRRLDRLQSGRRHRELCDRQRYWYGPPWRLDRLERRRRFAATRLCDRIGGRRSQRELDQYRRTRRAERRQRRQRLCDRRGRG